MAKDDPLMQFPLADPEFDPSTVPSVGKIIRGEVPGAILTEGEPVPELEALAPNMRSIFTKGGLVLTSSSQGPVIFNPDVIKLSEIKTLDAAGSLADVTPNIRDLAGNDEGAAGSSPAAPTERAPIPLLPAAGKAPSAGTQRKLAGARLGALSVGSRNPTDQVSPTGGSLLARVRQPIV